MEGGRALPEQGPVTEQDRAHLRRALELAEAGGGRVKPNPLVGAVIARGAEVIGEGSHLELGGLHAERAALADCETRREDPVGASLYVTLEPCAHQGRQPPCVDAVLEAGISRVVIAADDPSEKASGRGPEALRAAAVEVTFVEGPEADAARLQNQAFRKHARARRPLVTLKAAISLDGRTASAAGDSQWISGEASRELVHRWRAEAGAVAIGIGTALADDPLLTARGVEAAAQPLRVVFDGGARLGVGSRLATSIADAPLLVVAGPGAPADRVAALLAAGAELIEVAGDPASQVRAALDELGRRDVTSLLLEGGATLAGSFADAGEIDELRLFMAPLLLGGEGARPVAAGAGAATIAEAHRALAVEWEPSGEDLLVRARMREW